jgi:hypothetical protein
MKIKPTYTTLKQSKVLKEKGFDEECRMCVEDGDDRPLPFDCGRELHKNSLHPYYSAPEQWVVVEWLGVNHGIWIDVTLSSDSKFLNLIRDIKNPNTHLGIARVNDISFFNSPQEAYSAAFDYILTNNLI